MHLGETALPPNSLCPGIGPNFPPPSWGACVSWLWGCGHCCEQEGDRVRRGSLTCGGQGHRSPEGGSQLALGSSRTSPALCGTHLAAADPTQKAAPPEGRGWCMGHTEPRGTRQGWGQRRTGGGREWERAAQPVFRVPENQSGQEVVVPSDTGQPFARSSCGSAGPPGTPLWSPHAPWPAAGHTHPPVSTSWAHSSGPLALLPPSSNSQA